MFQLPSDAPVPSGSAAGFPWYSQGNGAFRAQAAAIHAADALPVADTLDIHSALRYTSPAAIAFTRVHIGPDHGDTVEQGIERSQWAEEAAEEPVAEDGSRYAQRQHQTLP